MEDILTGLKQPTCLSSRKIKKKKLMIKKSKLKCPKCKNTNDNDSENCKHCRTIIVKTGMLKKKDLKKLKEI